MTMRFVLGLAAAAALIGAAGAAQAQGALGGDPARGLATFKQQCSACHSTDPGVEGAAPNLRGVLGRKAGSDPKFTAYTPAIKASKVVWTTGNLDSFLSGPGRMIPGTAMPITVPDAKTRHDLVAYLASLHR
jgi:cytochrome c